MSLSVSTTSALLSAHIYVSFASVEVPSFNVVPLTVASFRSSFTRYVPVGRSDTPVAAYPFLSVVSTCITPPSGTSVPALFFTASPFLLIIANLIPFRLASPCGPSQVSKAPFFAISYFTTLIPARFCASAYVNVTAFSSSKEVESVLPLFKYTAEFSSTNWNKYMLLVPEIVAPVFTLLTIAPSFVNPAGAFVSSIVMVPRGII